ncbi:hypothetical protein QMK38_03780 [Lysinibacillus fusiformis]|nr:hypothetical protein [Lysinibacillus fusiformis]
MELHEIFIFGLIWGGLMFFFLTSFNEKQEKMPNKTFSQVFKRNLLEVVLHKKAVLALILLVFTMHYFMEFYASIQIYQQVHGEDGMMLKNPREHAVYYLVGVCIYTILIYLLSAFRKTYKAFEKSN